MIRTVFVGAVVAIVATSVTSGIANDDRPARVLRLESRATSINNFVDVGDPGPTPGDIYVFHDELFRVNGGQKVGDAEGRCNLVNPSEGRFECTIVSTFANGSITTDGILISVPGATSVGSITGGTGIYIGVQGEASLELGPPQGPHQLRFVLLRD